MTPRTAWQLDAFGHDPQFPGLCAGAGLTGSSWARGPFHQWGPLADPARDARVMQFPSEFEWIAPSGAGLLTHYMPAHYSAGWWMDSAATLADAEKAVYDLFLSLKPVAATRNVLLPVGTDYSPPNKWVTAVVRDWAARYTWPRFVCSVPRDFFAAVRSALDSPVPVSRDMNPVYTGKDVSYIDTKQAQRQAEVRLHAGETFASLSGAPFPASTVDGAWRRLLYGAHHDAVTGSEGDQVYLDLLAGWREAWSAAGSVRDSALAALLSTVDLTGPGTPVTVVNALAWPRTDVVRVTVPPGSWVLLDSAGSPVPAVLSDGTLEFVARDVPATGWRTYRLVPGSTPSWSAASGTTVHNERFSLTVDPARGGAVSSWVDGGRELVAPGRLGNEILLYAEYPQHPTFGEGPWHLLPTGPPRATSAGFPASVSAFSSPAGSRLVVRGRVDDVRFEQTLTLWSGLSRVDCATRLDPVGADRLLRLRWATSTRGLPVSEVGAAVVGRGWGIVDVDSAVHPWTLDNPAHSWFGVSATARVRLGSAAVPIGVAEVVAPPDLVASPAVRSLVVALVRAGVTSTTSVDDGSRYGSLAIDSNLPDTRVLVGGPDRNAVTAAVLASAPAHAEELGRQLDDSGAAVVYVPAARPLAEVWVPGADLRDVRALPALILAGEAAVAAVVDDLADFEIAVPPVGEPDAGWDGTSVALLSRGLPGFAVDSTGALHLSLVRACTGWPSGVWIDKPRRTVPDGSGFQLQHWTHTFDYALTAGAGDWRAAGFVPAGQGFTAPLHAVVGTPHPGALPATHSLLSVDPPGAAVVTAVKPAGAPLASGRTPTPAPLAVHLYEAAGRTTTVTLRLAGGVTAAYRADLLDEPLAPLPVAADGSVAVPLTPAEVTSVLLHAPSTVDFEVDGGPPRVVSARYWLENAGPAPDGNLPVTVHASPARGTGPTDLTVTAASSLADETWTGVVTVDAGPGWTVSPTEWPLTLPPGGWAEAPVRVVPARDAAPGDHPVTVSLTHAGRTVRDLAHLAGAELLATGPGAPHGLACLAVRVGGETRTLVANLTPAPLRVDGHGSWALAPFEVRRLA